MFHVVARTADHRLAFTTGPEAARLWSTVVRSAPGAVAICIMPDHVHVLVPGDVRARLGVALGGYARWRNARTGGRGRLWQRLPSAVEVRGDKKVRRNLRYIHLNPCRAGLTTDPLAWPLSTHLDLVGLALDPVRRRHDDPAHIHAYISGDPTCSLDGTYLPGLPGGPVDAGSVLDAVSMSTRTPRQHLRRSRATRELAIRCLRCLTPLSDVHIARRLGVSRTSLPRPRTGLDAGVRIIERLAADPRLTPLDGQVLALLRQGTRYRDAAP